MFKTKNEDIKATETYIRANIETMTYKEMASALNITVETVKYRAHKLGLNRPKKDTTIADYITCRIMKGDSNTEIIAKVKKEFNKNIDQSQISYTRKKINRYSNRVDGKVGDEKDNTAKEYTELLKQLAHNLRKGDKISFQHRDRVFIKPICAIYPNFVQVKINGRLESIPYTDILIGSKKSLTIE